MAHSKMAPFLCTEKVPTMGIFLFTEKNVFASVFWGRDRDMSVFQL